ncbi:MAG: zinc finger Ran-binding domain-containing protein [Gallionella sp.]|nr:zinc finger Ran-binding domain-containing protein [Gallionella sp.]
MQHFLQKMLHLVFERAFLMEHQDWTCSVCTQPNTAEAKECINCGCPADASSLEIKQRKLVYSKKHGYAASHSTFKTKAYISADGRPQSHAPLTVTPDESAKSYKAIGLLTSIILRACWLGLLIGAFLMGYFYFGSYYLGPSVYRIHTEGKFGSLLIIFQFVLYLVILIPSVVYGLLPLKLIDKKPLIVRFFYKISIPILFLSLVVWVSIK